MSVAIGVGQGAVVLLKRDLRRLAVRCAFGGFLVGFAAGLVVAPPTRAARADLDERAQVAGLIGDAARRWGIDERQMLRIAWCESRFNPRAYNPASRAAGVYQFVPDTWNWASEWADWAAGDGESLRARGPFDARANIETAAFVLANARNTGGARHWSACL